MKDLTIKIDDREVDYDYNSDNPLTFSYQLEDIANFQDKKSSESLAIELPATLKNQKILNTLNNSSVIDTSANRFFKGIRNFSAIVNGLEVFIGKVIPKKVTKKNRIPQSFTLNAFGNNGDWIIDLKELTLYDIVKHIKFDFTVDNIIKSWNFDGKNENLPYVFAPIKYAEWLDPDAGNDKNYSIKNMKPCISSYFIIYWAFKSIGYKIKSDFFNTDYYRRQVLPWVFGPFLSSESTKYEIHRFLAIGGEMQRFTKMNGYVDLQVRDDREGAYDNNNTIPPDGDYTGNDGVHGGGTDMIWKYNYPDFGILETWFSITLTYDFKLDDYGVSSSSAINLRLHWFKNGILIKDEEVVYAITHSTTSGSDMCTHWLKEKVQLGDTITCKVHLTIRRSKNATVARCNLQCNEFKIDCFRIPEGGQISFEMYSSLQKFKFLDILRGDTDLFNLTFQTDAVNKEVIIEPSHEYSISKDLSDKKEGYFINRGNNFNWTDKEDISKLSEIEIYDNNAREFLFKFMNDENDGALKVVQDRYKITLASGKYVFDDRFKAEKNTYENRFYAPTMHYFCDDFQHITGESPQMICMVPENISNTSSSESKNTFKPKKAYYKGVVTGVGGWKFNGKEYFNYPYLFAVNYKPGGEVDPILSYSDERINSNNSKFEVGVGLLKRFFLPRLAIMNNGQWLTTYFKIDNKNIINWYHRERITIDGELWELLNIKNYNALNDDSTQITLRKWVPVTKRDSDNTYPSRINVLTGAIEVVEEPQDTDSTALDKVFDEQYNPLVCLYGDIPRDSYN